MESLQSDSEYMTVIIYFHLSKIMILSHFIHFI